MGICNRCGHADAEALMLNEDLVRQMAREGIESFTSQMEDGYGGSFKELNELLENMEKITKGEICRCRAPHAINMEMIV
jgi:hypothetical protein